MAGDDKRAAMVELNCETDFMARNDVFQYPGFILGKDGSVSSGSREISFPFCSCIFGGLSRVAGLVTLEAEDSSAPLDALERVGSSVPMHIVAARCKAIILIKRSRELVSAAAVENERDGL
ncbi:elongation factor Ts, mitochondrial-like isoform X1 [Aegilops tauschii subsp. strangulata]|uniref:elongation factor Ts, mitochondrial-like isoform X1 n=1 Tax=Aegilops tauschii subsp. strangulata TaxID=200361 RepID=UPI003CC86709